MTYYVDCTCGRVVEVGETEAGLSVGCDCGRTLAVPSLRALRAGQGSLAEPPPELEIETLLLGNELRAADLCAVCGTLTNESVVCTTEIERARVQVNRSWSAYFLGALTFGVAGIILARLSCAPSQEWGKDRIYPLPLRVCAACRPTLDRPADLLAAMRRVPLYERLLDKYPKAVLSLPSAT